MHPGSPRILCNGKVLLPMPTSRPPHGQLASQPLTFASWLLGISKGCGLPFLPSFPHRVKESAAKKKNGHKEAFFKSVRKEM